MSTQPSIRRELARIIGLPVVALFIVITGQGLVVHLLFHEWCQAGLSAGAVAMWIYWFGRLRRMKP